MISVNVHNEDDLDRAITAGAEQIIVCEDFTITSSKTLPDDTIVSGLGNPTITKGFNGDMFTMGSRVQFMDLAIDGSGGSFSGRGFLISQAGKNDQRFLNVDVQDMDDACLDITVASTATNLRIVGGKWNRTLLGDAINLPDDGAVGNRFFIGMATGGGRLMNVGNSSATYIIASNFSGLTFGASSQGCVFQGNRWAESAITVSGGNHVFTGNTSGGASLTLDANATNCILSGNQFPPITLAAGAAGNNLFGNIVNSITDNSGNSSNVFFQEGLLKGLPTFSENVVTSASLEFEDTLGGSLGTINASAAKCAIIRNSEGTSAVSVQEIASVANSFDIAPATAGNPPAISLLGTDTNIDMRLLPKGTGVLRFGVRSAIGAETVTGYIEIKDSSGTTRKLAVVS